MANTYCSVQIFISKNTCETALKQLIFHLQNINININNHCYISILCIIIV